MIMARGLSAASSVVVTVSAAWLLASESLVAARNRLVEQVMPGGFVVAWLRWEAEVAAFEAERVPITAREGSMPPSAAPAHHRGR
jgi:hypothetical protein